MRVDANVSVRPVGSSELGTRCEIKNLNSTRSLGRAVAYEARRQVDLLTSGDRVRQETRHWDEEGGRTRPGRSKEEADDYRYFDEPDLVPLEPTAAQVAAVDAEMPLLPARRRARLAEAAGVEPVAVALHVERGLDDLALAAIEAGGDVARVLNHIEHDLAVDGAATLDAGHLAALTRMAAAGDLTATQSKTVLGEMVDTGEAPEAIAERLGFEAMGADALETAIDEVIAANADDWAEFCSTDDGKKVGKLTGFFVGQVMKATRGQADGKAVTASLQRRRQAG